MSGLVKFMLLFTYIADSPKGVPLDIEAWKSVETTTKNNEIVRRKKQYPPNLVYSIHRF